MDPSLMEGRHEQTCPLEAGLPMVAPMHSASFLWRQVRDGGPMGLGLPFGGEWGREEGQVRLQG
jgi:hypothetical protein